MSPEQMRGEELDVRTDLFSFGAVLYEMVTSRMVFAGNTTGVIQEAVLNRTPTPVGRVNPDLPPELERVINKALEKNRDLRYQHASDIRTDLRRLKRGTDSGRSVVSPAPVAPSCPWWRSRIALGIAAAALVAVLASGGWYYRSAGRGGETIDSLAVLPFVNASGDPNSEYLSDRGPAPGRRSRGGQSSFTRPTPSHRLFRAAHESLCDHVNFVNRLGIISYAVGGSILFSVRTRHSCALGIKDLFTTSGERHA